MRALILNSGMGTRMGTLTKAQPKAMTKLNDCETILSRQLKQLEKVGIKKVIMTTGAFDNVLEEYCYSLDLSLSYKFVLNPIFKTTNYIYSIYLAREYLNYDLVFMHGDLVFDGKILKYILKQKSSCMAVSTTMPLPEKDFKAVVEDGLITKVGIEFFNNALSAQPLYKLNKKDWQVWLDSIIDFCEKGRVSCYAENAFNMVSSKCYIHPLDVKNSLCTEVDNLADLKRVQSLLSF